MPIVLSRKESIKYNGAAIYDRIDPPKDTNAVLYFDDIELYVRSSLDPKVRDAVTLPEKSVERKYYKWKLLCLGALALALVSVAVRATNEVLNFL